MASTKKQAIKKFEELLRGKIDPELVAFGQALAECVQELPKGEYEVEVASYDNIEIKMRVKQHDLEYELLLTHNGEWILMSGPHAFVY